MFLSFNQTCLNERLLPNYPPYRRYHTITDVYTTALLLKKPSSDDDSGFRHGFGAIASLPLAQSAQAVSHDTTRLCQIVVALWDCQIHADKAYLGSFPCISSCLMEEVQD